MTGSRGSLPSLLAHLGVTFGADDPSPTAQAAHRLLLELAGSRWRSVRLARDRERGYCCFSGAGPALVAELPLFFYASLIARLKGVAGLDVGEKRLAQHGTIALSSPKGARFRATSWGVASGERFRLRKGLERS